jgi:hypothetical protein
MKEFGVREGSNDYRSRWGKELSMLSLVCRYGTIRKLGNKTAA